ncbi:VOC family protein [Tsukamurella sp. NPDC003166]|uniref:VOC family protein n=1 Tax=Tsukamurella sp. NPDC003166 TaxID=3154444 RepID=UPI0033BC8901
MGDESRQSVFPNLRYADPGTAITFLDAAFGFTTHFVVETGDGVEHAQLRVGDDLVFLGRAHGGDRYGMGTPGTLGGSTVALCVRVPDHSLDAHAQRAETAGARILNPVHASLAGVREYSCADPEGHVWTFSDYSGE